MINDSEYMTLDGLKVVYLKSGELVVAEDPAIITTIVGSCVSVSMFNKRRGLAAMCHAILSTCSENNACNFCQNRFDYVDCSISTMLEIFDSFGISKKNIDVKLFGGADIIPFVNGGGAETIGMQNILTAMDLLNKEGLNLTTYDVGGKKGRRLFFNTKTGQVLLKKRDNALLDKTANFLQPTLRAVS